MWKKRRTSRNCRENCDDDDDRRQDGHQRRRRTIVRFAERNEESYEDATASLESPQTEENHRFTVNASTLPLAMRRSSTKRDSSPQMKRYRRRRFIPAILRSHRDSRHRSLLSSSSLSSNRRKGSSQNSQHMHLAADEIEQLLLDVTQSSMNVGDQFMNDENENEIGTNSGDDDDDEGPSNPHNSTTTSSKNYNSRRRRLSVPNYYKFFRQRSSIPSTSHSNIRTSRRRTTTPTDNVTTNEASTMEVSNSHPHLPSPLSPPPNRNRNPNRNSNHELTEHDVNAYGLFDSAGSDEARLRHEIQRRRRRERAAATVTAAANTTAGTATTDENDDELTVLESIWESIFPPETTMTALNDPSQMSGVIYDLRKYASVPFFTPILAMLKALFCVLVIIRLLVSLLTVTVGWVVVIALSGRLFHQLWHRPIQLLRLLHARPLVTWTFLGGLTGMFHVCGNRILMKLAQLPSAQILLPSWVTSTLHIFWNKWQSWIDQYQWNDVVKDITTTATTTTTAIEQDAALGFCPAVMDYPFPAVISVESQAIVGFCNHLDDESSWAIISDTTSYDTRSFVEILLAMCLAMFSMQQDLELIGGLIQGLMYGIQAGMLWWMLLGHTAKPSSLAAWLYHNLWRFARRHYRELIRQRRRARLVRSVRQRQEWLRWQSRMDHRGGGGGGGGDATTTTTSPIMAGATTTTRDERKQCMICLEDFFDDTNDDDNVSSLYQRHVLLCRHSFHACCIQEWLEIKASCPICRIPLDEAVIMDDDDVNDDPLDETMRRTTTTTTSTLVPQTQTEVVEGD